MISFYLFAIVSEAAVSAIGSQKHEAGTKLIINALQQPKLNKQVNNSGLS